MNITKIKSQILIFSISAFLLSCGSTVEYTSAKMALQNENWDEAEKYLLEALKVEPQNAEVMVQIGIHVHARNQQWKEMNEMFKNAISINPEGKALGKPIKEKTQDIRRGFTRSYYEKGVNRYNNYFKTKDKKNLEGAIDSFEEALLIDPSLYQAYTNLALCHEQLGNTSEAIEIGKRAYEIAPDDFITNIMLGNMYLSTGNNEQALFHAQKSTSIDSSNSRAIALLANLYYLNGNIEKSVETYENAIKQENDDDKKAQHHFNLGVLYSKLEKFTEAEDNFFFAIELNPTDTEAILGIAQTLETAGKWRRASKFYRELITLEPENPMHYRSMSRVLVRQGDVEGSQKYLNKAKDLGG